MGSRCRWTIVGAAGLALVLAGVLIGRPHLAAQSIDVRLPGLQASVELLRDTNDVPHIFAASARDAYRTLGWVHASDRLWQMEVMRRTAQGRMAEVFGASFVGSDIQMRGLDVYRMAAADYDALPADTRADLDAYAAGVNAFLATQANQLPVQFQLAGVTPETWRPADSLAWFRLMSLSLSSGYGGKALRGALVSRISRGEFGALFPETNPSGPITTAALASFDRLRFAQKPPAQLPLQASNEWVVDGTLTASGKPLLANDPHLDLSAPILWYLARIVSPEMSVSGATVPGVPFHVLGHNERIAWGVTNTGGDVQDLFVEEIDPGDPTRYVTPNGTASFASRNEVIKVRLQSDISITVRSTRHGPVISDLDPFVAAATGGKVVALSFLDFVSHNTTPAALRAIARASNWADFRDALGQWRSPELNFVYADVEGNIGFLAAGVLPLRRKPNADFPISGADGDADWIGVTRFDQLPSEFNPASHMFVNANNQIVPDDFPIYITRRYGLPLRAIRILELLKARNHHNADDFLRYQVDIKAGDAAILVPRLLQAKVGGGPAEEALQLLRGWNFEMDRERPEPLIFMAWIFQLESALISERLSGILPNPIQFFDYDPYLILRLLDREVAMPQGTDRVAELLTKSLQSAVTALGSAYGQNVGSWRWGDAHRAALKDPMFGDMPGNTHRFDLSEPVSGGSHTVNAQVSRWDSGASFTSVQGPGYRCVYDLSALDASRFMIATGESGDPDSAHVGDMIQRWRDGGAITLSGTIDEVAATALERRHLAPALP